MYFFCGPFFFFFTVFSPISKKHMLKGWKKKGKKNMAYKNDMHEKRRKEKEKNMWYLTWWCGCDRLKRLLCSAFFLESACDVEVEAACAQHTNTQQRSGQDTTRSTRIHNVPCDVEVCSLHTLTSNATHYAATRRSHIQHSFFSFFWAAWLGGM